MRTLTGPAGGLPSAVAATDEERAGPHLLGARSWPAWLALELARRGARTVLVRKDHRGPLMVQSPFYPEDGVCHVYVLHPPGGLVGGDRLDLEIRAGPDTRTLVTTPAATKLYRCDGRRAAQRLAVRVEQGASFEWVPQENLLFDGADASVEARFELDPDAALLAWEGWCLGRPASGETFTRGRLRQDLQVWIDGVPQLVERLDLGAGSERQRASWGLGGLPAWSVALAYPADREALGTARALLHAHRSTLVRAGATLLDRLLVVRAQAPGALALSRGLRQLWRELRPRVLGRVPVAPRIWAT